MMSSIKQVTRTTSIPTLSFISSNMSNSKLTMETSKMLRNVAFALVIVCTLWLPSNGSSETKSCGQYDPGAMQARYESWQKIHCRKYSNRDEWHLRFGIYQSNVQFIDFVNSQNLSYKLADNEFADMTNDEFRYYKLGYRDVYRWTSPEQSHTYEYDNQTALPTTVDWRKRGAVTGIKDQGQCGSCWAFSAVAAMEGVNHIKTGKLISLSEQELVDCDVSSENKGCNGGLMEYAFEYATKVGGLTTEDDYPYTGKDGTCKTWKTRNHAVKITGYKQVPANDEKSLKAAVAKQPVSVAIDAGGSEFQLYSSGVFTGYCGNSLNHGVTAIGYGVENGQKYWLVKNSWGTKWGESGYIKMARGSTNKQGTCGIAMQASYPLKS